jgi:hypothetical protein
MLQKTPGKAISRRLSSIIERRLAESGAYLEILMDTVAEEDITIKSL